jgi:hypothetical protein
MLPVLFVLSDCIGSAFNAKGIMQCPNCRRIETGYWCYARGPHSSQDISNDDWVSDEELDSNPEASVVRDSKLCRYGLW